MSTLIMLGIVLFWRGRHRTLAGEPDLPNALFRIAPFRCMPTRLHSSPETIAASSCHALERQFGNHSGPDRFDVRQRA
jgi:hypothetical protein